MALEREDLMEAIGARLRSERGRRHLKQEEAARQIKVGTRTYQRWEKGKALPYQTSINKIKKAWKLDLNDLWQPDSDNGDIRPLLEEMNGKLDTLLKKDP